MKRSKLQTKRVREKVAADVAGGMSVIAACKKHKLAASNYYTHQRNAKKKKGETKIQIQEIKPRISSGKAMVIVSDNPELIGQILRGSYVY